MTDERFDRSGTDEPDGTTALQASLRRPGESLPGADTGDDLADLPAEDTLPARETSRAGYDVDDVSGAVDPNR
ncbi:hypothetical protein [Micromonospora globbae]|uniref:DUF5709 domain-containing protein n=1 Tax=Micromonospora globbae TaxID=1894969 RepID=A0A420EUG4_9ACTN|nr:hypothetical protein [Micromonospora globbae]RKF24324.1 hypothetical protein D7I43_26430 [Micromonospora globbae]WTF83487.1 hypothetical protein OH732_17120 [Micromonospora globbae]